MAKDQEPLGLPHGQLALASHTSAWADAFAAEALRITAALPGIVLSLDHIGSTAVPGLPAKPILDLAIAVEPADEAAVAKVLCDLGYRDKGIRSGRLFVRCDATDARTHNLHLYQSGDHELARQIAFRNALRSDAKLRDGYAALKQRLVAQLGSAGRHRYADAKAKFIAAAIKAS